VRTYLKNIALIDFPVTRTLCSTGFTVLRPSSVIEPKLLFRLVLADLFIDAVTPTQTGTHYPATSDAAVLSQHVTLPPLAEQRRILTKLEALLAKVNGSRKRLERIPAILKRFRQAVLAAACDGRLTETWRVANPQAVLTETTLGEIAVEFRTGPFGSALHQSDYVTNGVPIINPTNIVNGVLVPNSQVSVSLETAKRLTEYSLRAGDIIIARRGEMGRCAVVRKAEAKWLCGTGSALIRVGKEALPDFVQAFISSPETRRFLSEGAVGSTMSNLNQAVFKSIPISLPSIQEQREILRRIGELDAFADQVEARYVKAKAHVDRLTQSILAKAFRGELVPQDPNDEPAQALLERMKSTPVGASPPKRQGRPRKSIPVEAPSPKRRGRPKKTVV